MKNIIKSEQKELRFLLQSYDFNSAFRMIRIMLSRVGRNDYASIIYGLVKIDILHQNKDYDTAMNYLDKVLDNDFKFNVSFIKKMISRAEHKQDEREIIFIKEILQNAKQLDIDIETKAELYDCIESLEKKEEERNLDSVRLNVQRLVEREYKKLLDGEEIVLLDSRFSDKQEIIFDICGSYSDMRVFVVKDHKDRERIVFRYKDPLFSTTDFGQKTREGKQALKDKDYEKAKEIYAFLLCHGKPKHYIYKGLALSYAGLGEYKKALDLFTVTEALAREEGMNPHVSEIRNYILEQYLNSEKSSTRILEMINEVCKDAGTNYNEILEGLSYARIDMNIGTFLQVSLYEPDVFKKTLEIVREALEYKCQEKPYDKYSKGPEYKHISFKIIAAELRSKESEEKRQAKRMDFKPYVNIKSKDLSYDNELNLYGILEFDEFDAYLKESGLDVETAAEEFGFNEHQLNLIRLIYAREYFTQGFFEKGDEFIRAVEQDKGKDDYVKGQLSTIRDKKAFFRYRETDNPRVLSLTLKPKKKKPVE